jgi:hypothetical protein
MLEASQRLYIKRCVDVLEGSSPQQAVGYPELEPSDLLEIFGALFHPEVASPGLRVQILRVVPSSLTNTMQLFTANKGGTDDSDLVRCVTPWRRRPVVTKEVLRCLIN